MPAKEVVPEFGFREAPAAVAAAAMAAIREGGPRPAGPGRGRARTRREPAPVENMAPGTEEPPEPSAVAAGASESATSEARRRRRRRGGRGRGRGRGRTDEAAAGMPSGDANVAATEGDGISAGSRDPDDMREYTFEEADAATLAELGLPPSEDEPATPAVEAPRPRRARVRPTVAKDGDVMAEPPKPRRSRGGSRSAAATSPEDAPEAEPEAAKPRRRTAKPSGEAPAASVVSKPRTRSRAKPAPAPEAQAAGEEGIWKRFRSGRTKAP
jgi:ribonuclease E